MLHAARKRITSPVKSITSQWLKQHRNAPLVAHGEAPTVPVSSEVSDLLLFVSYFASLSEGTRFGDYFLICVV